MQFFESHLGRIVVELSCPALSRRYPGPIGRVGGRDELLRHEDRPQQRHLPPLAAPQQSAGHRHRQVTEPEEPATVKHTRTHARTHTCSSP